MFLSSRSGLKIKKKKSNRSNNDLSLSTLCLHTFFNSVAFANVVLSAMGIVENEKVTRCWSFLEEEDGVGSLR